MAYPLALTADPGRRACRSGSRTEQWEEKAMVKETRVSDFLKAIEGIRFPAMKEEVLAYARQQGAGTQEIHSIERYLPQRVYYSTTELMTEYQNASESVEA
jgi:hypothetical protein